MITRTNEEAAKALVKIGEPAVAPLIDALKDERLIVRVKSAYALYEVTGKDFGRSQEKWQEWWEKNRQNIPKGHGRK
ncbi:MAG: HEAT repeat domain-containing protein [Candidatus Scalindua sp.]